MKFINSEGKTLSSADIIDIFNRGAADLHAHEDGVRRIGRTLAQSVEEGRWIGEGFSTSRLEHIPTWLGGERDIRVTADGGEHLWLRWNETTHRYDILEGGRNVPAYRSRSIMDIPQNKAEFLRIEAERTA